MNVECEDFSKEDEMFDRIKKQGLEYEYTSDNPIAAKCIEWIDEWAIKEIEAYYDFVYGYLRGIIKSNILFKRCTLLEIYIEKIENTLNEPCDFEFFNLYEDLYKDMIVSFANEDYKQNYKITCMLADYRKEFNEKRQ